jgi:hypothetical protein
LQVECQQGSLLVEDLLSLVVSSAEAPDPAAIRQIYAKIRLRTRLEAIESTPATIAHARSVTRSLPPNTCMRRQERVCRSAGYQNTSQTSVVGMLVRQGLDAGTCVSRSPNWVGFLGPGRPKLTATRLSVAARGIRALAALASRAGY